MRSNWDVDVQEVSPILMKLDNIGRSLYGQPYSGHTLLLAPNARHWFLCGNMLHYHQSRSLKPLVDTSLRGPKPCNSMFMGTFLIRLCSVCRNWWILETLICTPSRLKPQSVFHGASRRLSWDSSPLAWCLLISQVRLLMTVDLKTRQWTWLGSS